MFAISRCRAGTFYSLCSFIQAICEGGFNLTVNNPTEKDVSISAVGLFSGPSCNDSDTLDFVYTSRVTSVTAGDFSTIPLAEAEIPEPGEAYPCGPGKMNMTDLQNEHYWKILQS